jgi:hypothetical protein
MIHPDHVRLWESETSSQIHGTAIDGEAQPSKEIEEMEKASSYKRELTGRG